MSIATVVTMGYGSFGDVNLIPTLGYSIGVVVILPPNPYIPARVQQQDTRLGRPQTTDTRLPNVPHASTYLHRAPDPL